MKKNLKNDWRGVPLKRMNGSELMKQECPFKFEVETYTCGIAADDLNPNIQYIEQELPKDMKYTGCEIMNTTRCKGEKNCPIYKLVRIDAR